MENASKIGIKICPIVDGTCDKKCGYKVHGLLKRAERCLVCNNKLTLLEGETHSFYCDICDPEHKVIISIG